MSREYPGDWDQRRKEVYQRDDYECQNCGAKGGPKGNVELHAHHVVPKASGGSHQLSNLKTVCEDCHDAIHNRVQAPTATVNKETEQAPTTTVREDLDTSGESDLASTLLVDWVARFGAIRLLLGDTAEEKHFETTHAQFGYLMYAREVYLDAYFDVLQFAGEGEPLPDRLQSRYTTARAVMRHTLGLADDEGNAASMEDLVGVARPLHQPRQSLTEIDVLNDLDDVDTVPEMMADWRENHPDNVPNGFGKFLQLTEDVVEAIETEFEIYEELVAVGSDGGVTLSGSIDDQWRLQEAWEQLDDTLAWWWSSFSILSERGMERATDGDSLDENVDEMLSMLDEWSPRKRGGAVIISSIFGGFFGVFAFTLLFSFVDTIAGFFFGMAIYGGIVSLFFTKTGINIAFK